MGQPEGFDEDIWDMNRLHRFCQTQWQFLAPVFATDYRYNLQPECIFPFIAKDELVREGAFSFVYKVTVHPAHANPSYSQVGRTRNSSGS